MKKSKQPILLIHGILMNSLVMRPLGYKFSKLGYRAVFFDYRTLQKNIDENAYLLSRYLLKKNLQDAIVISHSLGSLLIQRTLKTYANEINLSRVIAISPPFQGSQISQNLTQKHLSFILGNAKQTLLPKKKNTWQSKTPLGVIAGNRSAGLSKIFIENNQPNDGTVYVSETKIEGMRDHILLPYSHTNILFSQETVQQCDHFIKTLTFNHLM